MKFGNTKVYNFEGAFHGMRNPMNSWDKSDSVFGIINTDYDEYSWDVLEAWIKRNHSEIEDIEEADIKYPEEVNYIDEWLMKNGILRESEDDYLADVAFIGPADMELAQRLVRSGPEHRKFLRQIMVSVDITAPLYWWKEFDTYKVGTTANSTSTMHKLASTPITIDCFETDDMIENNLLEDFVPLLEKVRTLYNTTKDKKYWKELVRALPESWLQTRTVTMNYENILSICNQRCGHKLTEWQAFITWAKELPYAKSLIFYNENDTITS